MSRIVVRDVSVRYGQVLALDGVCLEVQEGEFFSLLGPSGCGKTTLLNVIAGFLEPSAGTVEIGGRNVLGLPPYRRNIGMVFQNYALFPHLNVFENVAYGLKVRKVPTAEIRRVVAEVLSLVHLEDYARHMPHQLSGGQQQRVAIARALAIRPAVLLLDEPLSNLDARLRKEMQWELRSLQRRVGITTILVTHDQEEALSLSDRIGVLGQGRLQQQDTPWVLYSRPVNRFVAHALGEANLLTAQRLGQDEPGSGRVLFAVPSFALAPDRPLLVSVPDGPALTGRDRVVLMLRPERVRLAPAGDTDEPLGPNEGLAQVEQSTYTGSAHRVRVRFREAGELLAVVPLEALPGPPLPGQWLRLSWEAADLTPLTGEEA